MFQRTMVRSLLSVLLFCLVLVPFSSADDWKYEETHSDSREFVSGGHVHVRCSVGDVHIRKGESNQIKVQYTVKSRREKNVKEARLDFNVNGSDATLEFHAPMGGNTNFDVELEVPQNTNLDVHQKVGDLTVDSIDGDKDLSLGVGDLRVATEHTGYHLLRRSDPDHRRVPRCSWPDHSGAA